MIKRIDIYTQPTLKQRVFEAGAQLLRLRSQNDERAGNVSADGIDIRYAPQRSGHVKMTVRGLDYQGHISPEAEDVLKGVLSDCARTYGIAPRDIHIVGNARGLNLRELRTHVLGDLFLDAEKRRAA